MISLYNVKWTSHTSGPSPIRNEFGPNCRVELFFMGCKIADEGHPCLNCFNPDLWKMQPKNEGIDPVEMAQAIYETAKYDYITIVGGEPLDQIDDLITLCKELKAKKDFHILVITHYLVEQLINDSKFKELINYIDMIIDGPFVEAKKIYNDIDYEDGFYNTIGSANQFIWDVRRYNLGETDSIEGIAAGDLVSMALNKNKNVNFITKDYFNENEHVHKISIK